MVTAQTIMSYEFFSSLDQSFVEDIANLGKVIEFEEGEWVFKQDTDAHNIYLISEGKVALAIMFREQIIDTLNPYMKGEIIGWSALVKPNIYTMGAKTEAPSTLIAFNGKDVLEIMEGNKEEGYKLLSNLTEVISERLVNRNIQLMSLRT